MENQGICLNCFSQRGDYEVCPYCGYVDGTPPREAYLLHPGVRLWGRYVVGTVLGIGGFGVTYRAWDTRLNTLVAIKEFYPQNLVSRIPGETKVRAFSGEKQAGYAQQLGRFLDEAKNMAKFTGDKHIVNVFDFFEDNGTAYIVMEYLDGMTLKEYMAQQGGRLPPQQAKEITEGLLAALQSIHDKGIIHRDISPDNLFILRDGSMKVLDFGAARFAVRDDSELTQGIVVKKGYAPPEQYRSNMKQGVWTDIYAAGATLYKMLTGITPEESIERYEKDTLARPSQTGTLKDAQLDKVIMKAMAVRPELRFKSAQAMLDALQNKTAIAFPEEELKKRKRARGIVVGLSVAAVIGLAVLIGWQASRAPVNLGGPSLADMDIAPDTITVMMYKDEAAEVTYTQLVAAFNEQYPEHTVNLELMEWYDGMYDDITPRFLTADAPTVFTYYFPNLDQETDPFMADLAPLYNALDTSELYLTEEFIDWYGYDEDEGGGIYGLPLGFYTDVVYISHAAAAERGMEVPGMPGTYDELLALERQMPGSVEMDPWRFSDVLASYEPQIGKNRDLTALEDRYVEYSQMYLTGYFQSWFPGRENSYSQFLYSFSESYTSELRYRARNQGGQYTIVPFGSDDSYCIEMSDVFAVSSYATENQQRVGMLFLRFLLSERAQNIMHVQNDSCQPVNKKALEQYLAANPDYGFLTPEFMAQAQLGRSSYYVRDFDSRLYAARDAVEQAYNNGDISDELLAASGQGVPAALSMYEDEVRTLVRDYYKDRWGG